MTYIDGTFTRTARKSHRCAKCKTAIEPGAQYAEHVGESSPYRSGVRYCFACADVELADVDTHPNHYAGKPLCDSDRIITGTMIGKSGVGEHEITHCKHCGGKMTRPVNTRTEAMKGKTR